MNAELRDQLIEITVGTHREQQKARREIEAACMTVTAIKHEYEARLIAARAAAKRLIQEYERTWGPYL
jgi:hypothetical protein